MALILVFPALMLLTLVYVAILAFDTPQIEEVTAQANTFEENIEYKLAA